MQLGGGKGKAAAARHGFEGQEVGDGGRDGIGLVPARQMKEMSS